MQDNNYKIKEKDLSVLRMTESIRKAMTIKSGHCTVIRSMLDIKHSHFPMSNKYHLDHHINICIESFNNSRKEKIQKKVDSMLKTMNFAERYGQIGTINWVNNTDKGKSVTDFIVSKKRRSFNQVHPISNILFKTIFPIDQYCFYESLDPITIYSNLILSELQSKSVTINLKLTDEPSITVRNNNVDITITNPVVINHIKQLLIKSL